MAEELKGFEMRKEYEIVEDWCFRLCQDDRAKIICDFLDQHHCDMCGAQGWATCSSSLLYAVCSGAALAGNAQVLKKLFAPQTLWWKYHEEMMPHWQLDVLRSASPTSVEAYEIFQGFGHNKGNAAHAIEYRNLDLTRFFLERILEDGHPLEQFQLNVLTGAVRSRCVKCIRYAFRFLQQHRVKETEEDVMNGIFEAFRGGMVDDLFYRDTLGLEVEGDLIENLREIFVNVETFVSPALIVQLLENVYCSALDFKYHQICDIIGEYMALYGFKAVGFNRFCEDLKDALPSSS